MYFWNINKLVAALQEDVISKKQKRRYYLAFLIIIALNFLLIPIAYDTDTNKFDIFDGIFSTVLFAITLIILIYIYKNRKRANIGFFFPFVSLTIPLLLRTILWTFISITVLYLILGIVAPDSTYFTSDESNILDSICMVIINIVISLMNIHYFRKICN